MSAGTFGVPFHFAIELVGLLVTGGAALLIPSRSALVPGGILNRLIATGGFVILAIAQVAHGAGFVVADGHHTLVLVRAAGYLLVLGGILGAAGNTPAAAAAVARDPVPFAPAAGALLLGVVAWRRSSAARLASLRWLSAGAFILAAGEGATAIEPAPDFGGSPEPFAYTVHAVRFLGYLALGAWIWTGARVSIRSRFVASFAALLMVVVLALGTALTAVISSNVERAEIGRLQIQLQAALRKIAGTDVSQLLAQARVLSDLEAAVRAPVAARRGLGRLTRDLAGDNVFGEFDFVLITDPRGRLLRAAGNEPIRSGEEAVKPRAAITDQKVGRLLGSPVLLDVLGGGVPRAAGPDRVDGSTAAIVAAHEIKSPGSAQTAGVLTMGRWLDWLTVDEITAVVRPARATLIGDATVIASRLGGAAAIADDVRAAGGATGTQSVRHQVGTGEYFTVSAPLTTDTGVRVAGLALSSPDRIIIQTRGDVVQSLFLVALGAAAAAVVLAWLSGRRITRPIQSLTRTAMAVREGNLEATAEVSGDDEVGQLGATFNEMTAALAATTADLREAVRSEGDLRARIETIVESMADGLVAVDAEGKILAFNPEAEQLTGVPASVAVGAPVEEILDARDVQGAPAPVPIFDLSEGSVGGIFLVRRSGAPVPVAVTCAVLRGPGDKIAGGVTVIRDVSREHDLERLKSEFLSNISHELRTPLTPIKGYADLLARAGAGSEKAAHFVEGILHSTERLERVVELLVDFSALEAGRLAPQSGSVDVGALLEQLAQSWRERAGRHDIVLEVGGELPPVSGDERLLRRSFNEILDNAVKFSPSGGRIEVVAHIRDGGDERVVEVCIADEGIGISSDDIPRIFSDFRQVDGSDTRAYGGLGLGLAFVSRIVEAHGGEIAVESEPERGTRFRISIPARPPPDVAKRATG